jgi:Cu/Ag efflux protein CusF
VRFGAFGYSEDEEMTMRKAMLVLAACLGGVAASVTAMAQMVDGVVTKVNEPAGKITIKHGPMKKFDMEGGMTMVFKANDPAMLKQVKPGDKVRFEADKVSGQFTIMKIEKAKK